MMELARVIGTVVSSRRVSGLDGVRMLLVQAEDPDGNAIGGPAVAACPGGAGVGERVWIVHGRESTGVLPDPFVPVDLSIVGIADGVGR
jgi:carbon dioxide concentrating mechanism protein CcmL